MLFGQSVACAKGDGQVRRSAPLPSPSPGGALGALHTDTSDIGAYRWTSGGSSRKLMLDLAEEPWEAASDTLGSARWIDLHFPRFGDLRPVLPISGHDSSRSGRKSSPREDLIVRKSPAQWDKGAERPLYKTFILCAGTTVPMGECLPCALLL